MDSLFVMKTLDSGRYRIVNAMSKKVLVLPHFADGTNIILDSSEGRGCEEWEVVRLDNGNYTIKNCAYDLYAGTRAACRVISGESVPMEWCIGEMTDAGLHVIIPVGTSLCWGLSKEDEATSITFSQEPYDSRNQWTFIHVDVELAGDPKASFASSLWEVSEIDTQGTDPVQMMHYDLGYDLGLSSIQHTSISQTTANANPRSRSDWPANTYSPGGFAPPPICHTDMNVSGTTWNLVGNQVNVPSGVRGPTPISPATTTFIRPGGVVRSIREIRITNGATMNFVPGAQYNFG